MSLGRRGAALLLVLLTVVTALIRAANLRFCLPHVRESDAVIVWQAGWLEAPDGVTDDNACPAEYYPWLLARVLAMLPGRGYIADLPPQAPLEEHLAAASEPFVRGRLLSLFLSILAIPLTYRLARLWLTREGALLAAALLATACLHTVLSQQARPHGPQTTMSLIAVLAALAFLRRRNARRLAAMAVSAGLAFGTLHTGLFAAPAAFLAARMGWHGGGPRRRTALLAILAALALAFLAFYPSPFTQLHLGNKSSGASALVLGDQPIVWTDWSPRGYLDIVPGWFQSDPVLVCLAGLGLVALCLRRATEPEARRRFFVAAAYPLGTLAVLGWHPQPQPRFFLGVFPYLALLGALGVVTLAGALGRASRAPRTALAVCSALALAIPVSVIARREQVRSRPDTATLLGEVLRAKARGVPVHTLEQFCAPVWMRPEGIRPGGRARRTPWLNYLAARLQGPPPEEALDVRYERKRVKALRRAAGDKERVREALRALGPGLLLVERFFRDGTQDSLGPGLSRERLSAILGPPPLTFDGRKPDPAALPWRLLPYSCRHPFEVERPGPVYEVYRLDALHPVHRPPREGG